MARKKRVRTDICPELKKEIQHISVEEGVSLSEASRIMAEKLKEYKRRKENFKFNI